MAHYIVDRIEGEYAYLEDESGKISPFKISLLPSNIAEGTHLNKTGDGFETAPSKETVKKKFDRIFKRREKYEI